MPLPLFRKKSSKLFSGIAISCIIKFFVHVVSATILDLGRLRDLNLDCEGWVKAGKLRWVNVFEKKSGKGVMNLLALVILNANRVTAHEATSHIQNSEIHYGCKVAPWIRAWLGFRCSFWGDFLLLDTAKCMCSKSDAVVKKKPQTKTNT